MSSAAFPAYLLARRVTRTRWLPFVVAVRRGRAVDHALVVPADRGRGLSGVRLGAARDPGDGRPPVGAQRPARGGGDRPRGARAHAVLRARTRPGRGDRPARRASTASAGDAARAPRARRRLRVGGVAALALVATGHALLGTYCDDRAAATRCRCRSSASAPAHLAIVALGGRPAAVPRRRRVARLEPRQRARHASGASFAWLAPSRRRRPDASRSRRSTSASAAGSCASATSSTSRR